MIIRPEHAEEARRAREHVAGNALRARTKGLTPRFVGHAYLVEAIKMMFPDIDNDRAVALASGFYVLAHADQNQPEGADIVAEFLASRSSNDPAVVERVRQFSGVPRSPVQ